MVYFSILRILFRLLTHLLLVSYFLEVALLHDILVVKDGVREFLLEDFFVEELSNASSHYGLL